MIIYGASGHGLVIHDILTKSGYTDLRFVDDAEKIDWIGGKVIRPQALASGTNPEAILAVGNNWARKKLASSKDFRYKTGIHPSAILAIPTEFIGEGTVIMAGVIINPEVKIGRHVIINTAATVDHECIIADFVHISPNATLSGDVLIGEGTHIGAGAVVIQGIRVGKWASIGAGAVVIRDVPDYAVVVGNPAKILKYNDALDE
jgi:sugar O-acyltransferase (sialic acid O-acetyltransferase NeuD family)